MCTPTNTLVVIGSNGMLGNYVKKYFQTKNKIRVIFLYRSDFNVGTDPIDKLEQILKSDLGSSTVVFNAVGLIPQSGSNLATESYTKINSQFPHELSRLCQSYGSKLIHPSTDCVYDGLKGSYVETDIHTEQNDYGMSKSKGEPADCAVIRASIIGEEIRNGKSLLEWVKSNIGGKINGFVNHHWNGITCLQYAKIIEQMIDESIFWTGVRHIRSPSPVSKYELVQMINSTFKLNIRIDKYEAPQAADKTLDTVYDENSLFNIPELSEQIVELKAFSDELYANNNPIPHILYLYWDGSPLSYLQYLTVVTFKKYNPDWKVQLYVPTVRFSAKTWSTGEQKTVYVGTDYLNLLYDLDIEIKYIDFESIGFRNDIPEVIKSDYLRYWLLGTYGGMWSDMDVIYLKPMKELLAVAQSVPLGETLDNLIVKGDRANINTVICYNIDHYPIGLFMSSPNNPFFLNLMRNAISNLNLGAYQSIGCTLVKKLYDHPNDIKRAHSDLNILVMSGDIYLPFAWYEIGGIFATNHPEKIKPNTVGIHWFNGSSVSVEYENMLDRGAFPTTGSIYPYIKTYLNILIEEIKWSNFPSG